MKSRILQVLSILLPLVAIGLSGLALRSHAPTGTFGVTNANNAQKVASWFVDPQNVSGCASDGNTCQSKTCASGSVGPCLTFTQIVSRWGTTHPQTAQNTVVDFLSPHTTTTDRIDVVPAFVNTGNQQTTFLTFTIQAETPTPCTGTLSSLNAKNRSLTTSSAMLAASSSCFTAVGLTVKNITRGTQAMTSQQVTGTNYSLTQPVNTTSFAEDDTWTNGDSISVYAPMNLFFGTIGADSSGFDEIILNNVSAWAPSGVGNNYLRVAGGSATLMEYSSAQTDIIDSSYGLDVFSSVLRGSFVSIGNAPSMQASAILSTVSWTGASGTVSSDTEWINRSGLMFFQTLGGTISNGGFYLDAAFLGGHGFTEIAPSTVVYGPGGIFVGQAFEYNTSSAASTFHLAAGVACSNASGPFGGAAACSSTNPTGSGASVTNCGIAITNTALDTCPASSTAFCNLAWSPEGCLIGKGNF